MALVLDPGTDPSTRKPAGKFSLEVNNDQKLLKNFIKKSKKA